MELNEELINKLIELKNYFYSENDVDKFLSAAKEVSTSMGINYQIMLSYILNKDKYLKHINSEIYLIDDRRTQINEELDVLNKRRTLLITSVCAIYGHTFDYKDDFSNQVCIVCGAKRQLSECENEKVKKKEFKIDNKDT